MKIKATLFLIASLLAGLWLPAQEIPESLRKRNELYFTFNINSSAEIAAITKVISIDKVNGKQVWAYANMEQFLRFQKQGYDITLLPAPGEGPGVEMKDHVVLSPLTVWNFYPSYTAYESIMAQFQALYPAICNLDTITTLASGRRLLVLKISDNVNVNESEPEFFYSSSIHGDETTGYILMLHLADYLLLNYGINPEATALVNNMEIYICPLANPDGTYYGGNASVSGARRANINGVDLNRNYQDPQDGLHPDGNAWQPETVAFMEFATQHHFVAGANFHGGAEVVNYPWDTWAMLHPDDIWCEYVSREYADTVHLHAPYTYMDDLENGVTNGYAWYEVNGGRQDYMNYYHHCREITIEISNTKLLPATQLLTHWDYNWRSFILWLKEAQYGIHGIITDQATGQPVAARVFINGHDNYNSEVYSSADVGDYHRMLKAGTYTLEISAPCYQTQTISGLVVSDHATLNLNIQLLPGPSAAVTTTTPTAITSIGAVSGGNVTCTGSTLVTARGVCWSTSANPVVAGNHTTDGSGAGSFISQITGLSPSTVYHVRAYATNSSGTYYGTDIQFSTSCGLVNSFPWTEGFENGGVIPNCWTQEQVNGSGLNWVFVAGNGSGYPAVAHTGSYNACLKDLTSAENKTKLISPALNLSSLPGPQLKFWHTQALWSPDQDLLSVYYKTSASGTWTLLTSYTASITVWTQETISLPGANSTYYIAFEGNAKYGRGVCVDDVEISSSCSVIYPVSISITASANPVEAGTQVTFTALPVNGGTSPIFQWKVNGANTGGNLSTFSYSPADGDLVSCSLTAAELCTSSNPAASNVISMVVNSVPLTSVLQNISVTGSECYNAQQTIEVAGGTATFTVVAGGQATMIAGMNILYYPGTVVAAGGYLWGYITPSGPWCNTPAMVNVIAGAPDADRHTGMPGCQIFPNPTSNRFVLAFEEPILKYHYLSEIYNMKGEKLVSRELSGSGQYEFTLSGLPRGIYLIRIFDGQISRAMRIVLQD